MGAAGAVGIRSCRGRARCNGGMQCGAEYDGGDWRCRSAGKAWMLKSEAPLGGWRAGWCARREHKVLRAVSANLMLMVQVLMTFTQ